MSIVKSHRLSVCTSPLTRSWLRAESSVAVEESIKKTTRLRCYFHHELGPCEGAGLIQIGPLVCLNEILWGPRCCVRQERYMSKRSLSQLRCLLVVLRLLTNFTFHQDLGNHPMKMASRVTTGLFLFACAQMVLASGQIKLFINQLPEYSSMADCAEGQVSTIVRNMADGCGDGSKTTSYNCFCHTSSSYFNSLIGAKVERACATDNPDLQKTSALDLFGAYCHLGDSLTSSKSARHNLKRADTD